VFHFENCAEIAKRTSSSTYQKKAFHKSESSYEKLSLYHITVKTTDKYDSLSKNEMDKSNIQSKKQSDKLDEHKIYQSKIENLDAFTTTSEIKKPVSYGVLKTINQLNGHHQCSLSKNKPNPQIYYRFKRGEQKDSIQNLSNPKSPKNKYTNCNSFNYNFFGHKHGILQHHTIPDYKSLKDN
jgi:hypothetical protein